MFYGLVCESLALSGFKSQAIFNIIDHRNTYLGFRNLQLGDMTYVSLDSPQHQPPLSVSECVCV